MATSNMAETLARLRAAKAASAAPAAVVTAATPTAAPRPVPAPVVQATTQAPELDILDQSPVNTPAVVTRAVGTGGNAINVLEVQAKIAELSERLLTAHPLMPVLLRTIHDHLRKDPEIVTLLSEEEIGIYVNGLKVQTNTALVTAATKATKSPSEKAKLKALTADDL